MSEARLTEAELLAAHGVRPYATDAALQRARGSLVAFGRHRDPCRKGRVVSLSSTGEPILVARCVCGLDEAIDDIFRACSEFADEQAQRIGP